MKSEQILRARRKKKSQEKRFLSKGRACANARSRELGVFKEQQKASKCGWSRLSEEESGTKSQRVFKELECYAK